MEKLFITGIGTDIGKTIVSSIVVEALNADYWKPIQSGDLHLTDTMKVQSFVSNNTSVFHSEVYKFQNPLSPHAAAEIEQIRIDLEQIKLPQTNNRLIIEGAGGLMVPLNDQHFIIDLIQKTDAEVILVSRNYLGSINHTLLTYELLKQRNIKIKGLIFNGNESMATENSIVNYTKLPVLLNINEEQLFTKEIVAAYAKSFLKNYKSSFV